MKVIFRFQDVLEVVDDDVSLAWAVALASMLVVPLAPLSDPTG